VGEAPDEQDGQEREPDYRFTLANERTFLAWLRTSLSLLAAGVAVVQLLPEFAIPGTRAVVGGLLTALAVVTAFGGVVRWRAVETAIRRGRPLPRQRLPYVLAAGLVTLALLGLVIVAFRSAA
jgi:putative membrane protein